MFRLFVYLCPIIDVLGVAAMLSLIGLRPEPAQTAAPIRDADLF